MESSVPQQQEEQVVVVEEEEAGPPRPPRVDRRVVLRTFGKLEVGEGSPRHRHRLQSRAVIRKKYILWDFVTSCLFASICAELLHPDRQFAQN